MHICCMSVCLYVHVKHFVTHSKGNKNKDIIVIIIRKGLYIYFGWMYVLGERRSIFVCLTRMSQVTLSWNMWQHPHLMGVSQTHQVAYGPLSSLTTDIHETCSLMMDIQRFHSASAEIVSTLIKPFRTEEAFRMRGETSSSCFQHFSGLFSAGSNRETVRQTLSPPPGCGENCIFPHVDARQRHSITD